MRFIMLLTGIAIGIGIGRLYAPEAGVNVRRRIARSAKTYANEMVDSATERGKEVLESAAGQLKETTQKAFGAVTK
jgi:hypothetical protein